MSDSLMRQQEPHSRMRHDLLAECSTPKPTPAIVIMFREKLKRRKLQKDTKPLNVETVETSTEQKSPMPVLRKARSKSKSLRTAGLRSPTIPTRNSNMTDRMDYYKTELADNFKADRESVQYEEARAHLVTAERETAWDAPARSRASPKELRAQEIVFKIRESERVDPDLFGNVPGEALPDPKSREMGGQFLVNLDRIRRSKIFKIASQMPKGCHQHLHFNSEIPPEHLFPSARSPEMEDTMFIRSTRPLREEHDFQQAEIVFNVLPSTIRKADIFAKDYNPAFRDQTNAPWMRWVDFRKKFPSTIKPREPLEGLDDAENWAREKMIISVHQAYGEGQTTNGAWACFNQGTRAFKGLLGYEGIYRWYVEHAVESMIHDKVMYAELRPMLLDKAIPSNDGLRQLDHEAQMNIILEEITKKRAQLEAKGDLDKFPFGVKIIYCTPRSIPREKMKKELQDCLTLKLKFPDLICGFDLVGAEDRPNSINYYSDLLLAFAKTCDSLGISIPFMFHAGETLLDTGGSHDPDNSNLYDSLLLHSKRIGHGYALLKHPVLTERYKAANICLELCPISNELLRLCGNAREHPYPQLLAAGLHCTLNADNPSLFSSSLSHEFYQVMVGDPRMTIHGWKQLAEWSIEHSCLSPADIMEAKEIHGEAWEAFCGWVVTTYGEFADSLMDLT